MTDKVEYPEHLDPEIIKGALFIHNAEDKEEADNRMMFLAKHLGNQKNVLCNGDVNATIFNGYS